MKSGNPQVSGTSRRNESCFLSMPYVQSAFSVLKVKMGCGGQDEPSGKSGITSDEKRVVS